MKKYLLGLVAVVVALSLSAFTGDYKKIPAGKGNANLHWFEAPYNAANFQATTSSVLQRTSQVDCDEPITTECERGYRDDQLNTFGVPGSGVNPDEKAKYEEIIYVIEQ